MESGEQRYIWEDCDWPTWRYDLAALAGPLAEASRAQGLLLGRLADVGVALRDQASLLALTEDVVKTSEIEGEVLNVASVRSSIARRLGVDIGAVAPVDRNVEGVVDMVLDATSRAASPLRVERLCGWHAALFPTGFSGMSKIAVGKWRSDGDGPMQVVSGPVGRRQVHFEAPPADRLPKEMDQFLAWANGDSGEPALVKAGLAHLWFVTLHPFDDGNGRIARAIGDLFLERADGSTQRFYSLSAQIQRERKDYYDVLERTQKSTLDVTGWLAWFLGALERAVNSAHGTLDAVLVKARFWQRWAGITLNERQVKVLNRALDGLEGRLTSSKWASLAKCSPDTALRDITQLLDLGVLTRAPGGGRSTAYELAGASGNCNLIPTGIGAVQLGANFAGDASHHPSSASSAHQIDRAGTATVAGAPFWPQFPAEPPRQFEPLRFPVAIDVLAPGAGTAGGTITVQAAVGAENCAIVLPANHCDLVPQTAGARDFAVSYGGDSHFLPSSASVQVQVLPDALFGSGFEQ